MFGGRVLTATIGNEETRLSGSPDYPQFSGLYAYHVPTNSWKKLRDDVAGNSTQSPLRSRTGHSMLFHENTRMLYIFAGQRQKEYLSDFLTYKVDTDEVTVICDGIDEDVPAAGFTQRATIDPELNEIHVLSVIVCDRGVVSSELTAVHSTWSQGINKDKEKRDENVKNSFWVYDMLENRWSCIYRNESKPDDLQQASSSSNADDSEGPRPRFAHQLVYDHLKKVHYLFGGNPGPNKNGAMNKERLDDFWSLEVSVA